jgi:hypothetical protein
MPFCARSSFMRELCENPYRTVRFRPGHTIVGPGRILRRFHLKTRFATALVALLSLATVALAGAAPLMPW